MNGDIRARAIWLLERVEADLEYVEDFELHEHDFLTGLVSEVKAYLTADNEAKKAREA